MNVNENLAPETREPAAGQIDPSSARIAAALGPATVAALGGKRAMKLLLQVKPSDQINAAIDEWAEALVSIIEASDNPEASMLRAHLAIAMKRKELEKMAWQELETRQGTGLRE
jgi:hypothetical protein